MLKDVADDFAGFADALVSRLMTVKIVDLFQIVHIQDGDGEGRLAMFLDLAVHPFFHPCIGMPVFDACQGVDAGLGMRLRNTLSEFFLLPHLCVNIVEAYDQTGAFLFFHHGRLQLDITRVSFYHDPVTQGEDAAAFNLCHYVLFGENREEVLLVLRMVEDIACAPDRAKEVRTFLRLGKVRLINGGGAEFTVTAGLRFHHIDAEKVACDGMKTGVDNTLLHHLLLRAALLHLLVDIRYSQDDETLIVLHTGNSHSYIKRSSLFDSAVDQLKHVGTVQSLREEPAVHGLNKCRLIVRMDKQLHIPFAAFKEIRAMPRLGEHAVVVVGM